MLCTLDRMMQRAIAGKLLRAGADHHGSYGQGKAERMPFRAGHVMHSLCYNLFHGMP